MNEHVIAIVPASTKTAARDVTSFAEADRTAVDMQFRVLADLMPTMCWMANADGWIYWYN